MMPTSPSITERIRELVYSVLIELGATPAHDRPRETMLIRNGNYCGHRYRLGDFEAVWFIEEDELKFSSSGGGVICKMIASEALASRQVQQPKVAA